MAKPKTAKQSHKEGHNLTEEEKQAELKQRGEAFVAEFQPLLNELQDKYHMVLVPTPHANIKPDGSIKYWANNIVMDTLYVKKPEGTPESD